jgi:hypothetical protein
MFQYPLAVRFTPSDKIDKISHLNQIFPAGACGCVQSAALKKAKPSHYFWTGKYAQIAYFIYNTCILSHLLKLLKQAWL